MFKDICEICKADLAWATLEGKRVCHDCQEDLLEEIEQSRREE